MKKSISYLLIIIIVFLICYYIYYICYKSNSMFAENFENLSNNSLGLENTVNVQDMYPPIGLNQISNVKSSDVWWKSPIFTLGSYEQITNNLKYNYNPDIGNCMPISMCNAVYNNKYLGSNKSKNVVSMLPVNCGGSRVGPFMTNGNLLLDIQNVLY